MEGTTENIPTIPSLDGLPVGTWPTRINWPKLKREIHACVAFQRKVGTDAYLCDMSLYATYLYCVAAQARGHLHMKVWNIDYQYKYEPGKTENPRLGKLELKTLDDQQQFIECTVKFIRHRQDWMKKYNIISIFKDLPTDFNMTEDEMFEQDLNNLAAKKARLVAKGLPTEEVDAQIVGLSTMMRFHQS